MKQSKVKIYTVVGCRPNWMKIDKEMKNQYLINTQQHYDYEMSQIFFRQLKLPKPHVNLGCKNSGQMFDKLLALFKKDKPNLVIVYGDTLSALMGALAASYVNIPIAHIEAGCRSFMHMPEETNRVLIDRISAVKFCTTLNCLKNLHNEKIMDHAIYIKGDPMFDAMNSFLPIKRTKDYRKYILLTIHRNFNADNKERLQQIFSALGKTDFNYIFPIHPRTTDFIARNSLLHCPINIKAIKPVGYKEMLSLESNALKIITDSGGVQREAYWMRIPCIVLRKETEWIETVTDNWAVLVDADIDKIVNAVNNFHGADIRKDVSEIPLFGVHKRIRDKLFKYI